MLSLREISQHSVVQLEKGMILGTVDDVVFDEKSAEVKGLVIFGRARLFGLLGRQPDLQIPWEEIISFGRDVILVSTDADRPDDGFSVKKSRLLQRLFAHR